VQFYVGIAFVFWLLGLRGLMLIPVFCLAVTGYRMATGTEISIVTYLRIDEILAGGMLALLYEGKLGKLRLDALKLLNPYALVALLLICCHPDSGLANYLRPYVAASLVGFTLLERQSAVATNLKTRWLTYVAAISYALYVVHPLLAHTWLGSGDTLVKYAKRPLLFVAIFLVAHLSTFHLEHRCIALGKRLSARLKPRPREQVRPG
jgi:peptidoglycan/LPS O-acetylase OafA/YrhL